MDGRVHQLFGDLLVFVYHCFDRIVIRGYLSGLSRPEQVVHFFRQIVGVAAVDKEVLSRRTCETRVEAYVHNHGLPIEWAEKGVRKEDHVLPWLRRMTKTNRYGVHFVFKSMEQVSTFRITVPKYPTADPNYRILAHQRSRFTHYYFYIRDEVLGPVRGGVIPCAYSTTGIQQPRSVVTGFRVRLRFAEPAIGRAKGATRWAPRNDKLEIRCI